MTNKCKICSLFEEKQLIEEVKFDINKQIKQRQSLDILNKQTGFNLSEYHYKKHLNTCLINFELPINDNIDNKIDNLDNKINFIKSKKSYQEMLNIDSVMEQYRKISFDDKQEHKLNLLDEIEYLVINNVHYQLINGCIDVSFKHLVPKEDISSLKAVNDIMKTKSEEVKIMNKKHEENLFEHVLPEQMDTIRIWIEEGIERGKKLKNNTI